MKKLKSTLFLSGGLLLLMSNNCFAASSSDTSTNQMKYIAIGVAVVIVLLLLFLGFKMDSKDNGETFAKPKKSKKKEPVAEETKYEEDTVSYENDAVTPTDLSETTEYEEDEDSLFDTMDEDNLDGVSGDDGLYTDTNTIEPEEEYGEEFDTSVIDNIEDEEDIVIPEKVSDETMIFNNPPVDEPVEENLNETSEVYEQPTANENEEIDETLAEEMNEVDPLMDELSKVNPEVESDFGGFSVSSGTQATEDTEKAPKKYTKAKKAESTESAGMTQEDFLAQMEENMKKDKAERDAKKETKKKK